MYKRLINVKSAARACIPSLVCSCNAFTFQLSRHFPLAVVAAAAVARAGGMLECLEVASAAVVVVVVAAEVQAVAHLPMRFEMLAPVPQKIHSTTFGEGLC